MCNFYHLFFKCLACKVCESLLQNLLGNVKFSPKKMVFPQSNEDVVNIVKNCKGINLISEII